MRRWTRRAVTLVEILVASVVASMLLVVLWRLFYGSMHQFHHTQLNMEAMQVGQMALEYIENDVHGLILKGQADGSLLTTCRPKSIDFRVARNAGNTGPHGPIYACERVQYGFQPVDGKPFGLLTRQGKAMAGMRLKDIEFRVIEIQSLQDLPHYFLRTTLTATDNQGRKDFTLQGIVALEIITHTRLGGEWQPNPYLYKKL